MKFMKLKFETTLKIYEYIIQHIAPWQLLKMIGNIPCKAYIELCGAFAKAGNNHRLDVVLCC